MLKLQLLRYQHQKQLQQLVNYEIIQSEIIFSNGKHFNNLAATTTKPTTTCNFKKVVPVLS
jgi:hypothetical protein